MNILPQYDPQENIDIGFNYPIAVQYPPPPAPPAPRDLQNKQWCCWSLTVRQQQVESFLEETASKRVYLFFFYILCLAFYLAFYGCAANQAFQMYSNRYSVDYDYYRMEIFGDEKNCYYDEQQQCQSYERSEKDQIINYLDQLSLYLLCYACYFDKKNPVYRITRLMQKFYSSNPLLLIFTSGTAVGFSPSIMIQIQSTCSGQYCVTQVDVNVINNLNNFLYGLSALFVSQFHLLK
ncbi:hypothetical protein ABPG72_022189 [Tetrahymena utriculariae]